MNILKSINLFRYLKISFLIAIISFAASCTKTNDEDVDIDDRDKLIGTWNCSETQGDGDLTNFTVTISKHTNSSQVILNNFYHSGTDVNVYAVVAGSTITFPKQVVCEGTDIETGTGTYSNNKINFTYKIKIEPNYDNCTAVFTKQ